MWPAPRDEAGWAEVVARDELDRCPPGFAVGALRALFVAGDARLVNTLAAHVSERVTRRLRRLIGTDHANDGKDIVELAHGRLMAAIFDPVSGDGDDLVAAFWPRTRFRGIDAARVENTYHRRHLGIGCDDDGEPLVSPTRRLDGGPGSIDVEHLLSRVRDPKRRLAFCLFLQGMRVRSGDPCIASVLGCDPKTAARYVAEARAILAAEIGG